MEFRDSSALKTKVGNSSLGISKFIRESVLALPDGKGCRMSDLAEITQTKFPTVRNRGQAYARINIVLSKANLHGLFVKKVDENGYTWIVKEAIAEAKADEQELEQLDDGLRS